MMQRGNERAAFAHIELGLKYLYGNGVERNHVRALMWFKLAATEDQPSAGKYCDSMAASMTPLQISQAQALAEICRTSDYTECD
jgi:TPR repeat protein